MNENPSQLKKQVPTDNCVEEYVVNEVEFDDNAPSTHEHFSLTNCNYYYFCARLLHNIIL